MTEPKPLTYDEHKAAKAAFRGGPPNSDWTDSAQEIYARLSAAIVKRTAGGLTSARLWDCGKVTRQSIPSWLRQDPLHRHDLRSTGL